MTSILLTLFHHLPLLCSSFSGITSSNRRQPSLLLADMGRNRSGPVGPLDRQGGVSDTIQYKTSFPEPYSVSSFWSLHKPKSLHQGTEAGTDIRSRTWSSAPHVSGRLAPQPQLLSKILLPDTLADKSMLSLGLDIANSEGGKISVDSYLDSSLFRNLDRLPDGESWPAEKRISKWLALAQEFLVLQSPPPNLWLQVLGHLVSLEKLVSFSRIRIRPLQWQLRAP